MITAEFNNKNYRIDFVENTYLKGKINNNNFLIDKIINNENSFHVLFKQKSFNINIISVDTEEKKVLLNINNNSYTIKLTEELDILLKKMGIKNQTEKIKKELKAPMPGLIVKIPVKKGDFLKQGEILLVLEAMKMENNLKAEHDITIKNILVQNGNSVEKNEVLIIFE
ncbi:MAG: acetyl-CoA carboxylase biotin carboxyl carrier protein subunit [Chlorobi bacterium]|nr:acetyl-CoA carboxylase biotin carboxyl carrier protein subunit [Chlorobiota bacterium]